MKRILIVNVNWIGDTLFATPFIRAIRENHPESYIAVLTHPRCHEILKGNPNINEIILFKDKHLLSKFSLVSRLKRKRFDAAFILRGSLTMAMLLLLSAVPERIGFDNRKSGFLLTKKVQPVSKDGHKVEYFLEIAKSIGIVAKTKNYEIFISDSHKDAADRVLEEEGLKRREDFIAINPGGNWSLKRWALENFARLGDEVINKFNMKVVLTGAEKDIESCRCISNMMKIKPVLVCGKTDLKTLGAIFKRAKWVISNDSGPMHIAVAVRTPVIALFGPTSPKITGPYGEGFYKVLQKDIGCQIPCYNLSCEDNKCMEAITVEDVMRALT